MTLSHTRLLSGRQVLVYLFSSPPCLPPVAHTAANYCLAESKLARTGQEHSAFLAKSSRGVSRYPGHSNLDCGQEHVSRSVAMWPIKLLIPFDRSLTAGTGERWEVRLPPLLYPTNFQQPLCLQKTLRETLRNHYCFIAHSSASNRRNVRYSCDPTVDPSLKRHNGVKRALDSSGAYSNITSPRTTTSPSLPPVPEPVQDGHQKKDISAAQSQPRDLDENLGTPMFEVETSEVYERRRRSGGEVRIFYCQKCGPYVLERQRWDGRIVTKGVSQRFSFACGVIHGPDPCSQLARLVRLLYGKRIAGASLKVLFGLEEHQGQFLRRLQKASWLNL